MSGSAIHILLPPRTPRPIPRSESSPLPGPPIEPGPRRSSPGRQKTFQENRWNPPSETLDTIHEHHRDEIGISRSGIGILIEIVFDDLVVPKTKSPLQDSLRLLAEGAIGPRVEVDPNGFTQGPLMIARQRIPSPR